MPRFREATWFPTTPLTADAVRALVTDCLSPRHFFTLGELEWTGPTREETSWEVFQERLLPPAQTRLRATFESWHVFAREGVERSGEPILSVKLDLARGELHVVRALLCRAWEGYSGEGNVILSREVERWERELVATLKLARFGDLEELGDELICSLFHAVVGTSRLPLTSLEAPLPGFSLGRLGYFARPTGTGPVTSTQALATEMFGPHLTRLEMAKLLEAFLRSEKKGVRDLFPEAGELIEIMFNEVSLSPYTGLVDNALSLLQSIGATDVLAQLLRQLCRHLTAYDLVKFHHMGANYPDALFLDALVKAYFTEIERRPELFLGAAMDSPVDRDRKRLRRRALRQGWMLRRRYEGHAVPDAPTSPGENLRVLPEPFVRVSEEQILQPQRRSRRLFADDPLDPLMTDRAGQVLDASLDDLRHPRELMELGTALFLDRPLGIGKRPTAPDRTPLLSHVAFSRSVAERRLRDLGVDLDVLTSLTVSGVPLDSLNVRSRPGVVSLGDAPLVATDWLLVRTTARSLQGFASVFDLSPLGGPCRLILGEGPRLVLYDEQLRPRAELTFRPEAGYEMRGGVEYPADGLHVVRVGDETRVEKETDQKIRTR